MEAKLGWPCVGFQLIAISCGDTHAVEGTSGGWTGMESASSSDSGMSSVDSPMSESDSVGSTSDPSGPSPGSDSTPSATRGTDNSEGSTSGSASEDAIRFDTPAGGVTTAGEGGGSCNCGSTNWSYIWIANTNESTVAKINTRTLVEEGRYITRPDKEGSPSRTSVSIDGKAVVVANRHAGLVKIWARPEFCAGGNTSTGKNDVKAWGSDECVAWYTDFPEATVQRPVAWTSGTLNPATCQYENQKIWTTTGRNGSRPGYCGQGGIWIHRLDGDTGDVEDTIHIPDEQFTCDSGGWVADSYGPYGGAVDYGGNFWFQSWEASKLVRVDFRTLDYEFFDGSGYGITVDTKGRVWLSNSISRFDYSTKQWATAPVSSSGGIAQDLQGRIWAAGQNGVVWVDMETLAVGGTVALPGPDFGGGGQIKGVSVDIDGYIWAVYISHTKAYKIDPNTFAYQSYDGVNEPYTYSDMTGGQISNVECNPPAG